MTTPGRNDRIPAGCGYSTVLPGMDFETYSEAGYWFDPLGRRWRPVMKSQKSGIAAVGAAAYSEHPSTEVLSLAYDLKEGAGCRLWTPAMDPPRELFDYLAGGGLIQAWNSAFEYLIWTNVCTPRLGWPALPLAQLRDAMAKARAHGLPGGLGNVSKALDAETQKIEDGKRLLNKFSRPRNPTKADDRLRLLPEPGDPDTVALYAYNLGDVDTEAAVSNLCPDLSDHELAVWLTDQRVNMRGVAVDVASARACQSIVNKALARGVHRIQAASRGEIEAPTQVQRITEWVNARGARMATLDADAIAAALDRPDLPADVRAVLEIRASLGAASVKKLAAILRSVSTDGRLRDLFSYCGAERTGRWAGRGTQPQNLTNSGPEVRLCSCGRYHRAEDARGCPWCGRPAVFSPWVAWNAEAAKDALAAASAGDLDLFEYFFGDAVPVLSGCLRAIFCAAPGHELISSDYTAIEAVCLAALAGEEWRLEVFRTHGKIYEMSASKITGVPFEEFTRHKKETGEHHPLRKSIGKVAELASGYQGWIGAWKAFGADRHFKTEDDIAEAVMAWRSESPAICSFWAGLEAAARAAILQPGVVQRYRSIAYGVRAGVLYCQLPSGRLLAYHEPVITPSMRFGRPVEKISYMGWNSDYTKGPIGWTRLTTYGGKLAENVTQAVARDILAHALVNLDRGGYPVVLHAHDEAISEVPEGFGSVGEYESIMEDTPAWCRDWPIKASGGWRGRRYRKD